jgi:MFS family permease
MAFAESIPTLMVGSFFTGLCVGLASQICPVYLSEISPNQIRGASISIFVLGVNLGPILSLLVSIARDRDWRLMLGITAVPAIL